MADRQSDNVRIPDDDRVDAELLQRIAACDRQALTELYGRYYHPLLRFMHRLSGDLDSAQEGVNDVMLVVWDKAGTFAGRSRPGTWIMGIAYRKALKSRSGLHKWRHRFKAADWDEVIEPVAGAEGLTESLDRQDLLGRAIQRLSAKQRAVVELTYYFGFSYEEIARIVQCPENTVKTRMFHARAKLKAILQRMGESGVD